jgi:hypothetical protein
MSQPAHLQASLDALMMRLVELARFPKYSLERRIDIFLVPFVEALLKATDPGARLVAPEFPVLADLRKAGPDATVPPPEERPKLSRRTVNVDYLFHLPGPPPEWLFVELKTDVRSFNAKQADLYATARLRGMPRLRADLDFVCSESKHRDKYEHLLSRLRDIGLEAPVRIAYLAPGVLQQKPAFQECRDRCGLGFFSLEDLDRHASRADPRYAPLWPTVKSLLSRALRASD